MSTGRVWLCLTQTIKNWAIFWIILHLLESGKCWHLGLQHQSIWQPEVDNSTCLCLTNYLISNIQRWGSRVFAINDKPWFDEFFENSYFQQKWVHHCILTTFFKFLPNLRCAIINQIYLNWKMKILNEKLMNYLI